MIGTTTRAPAVLINEEPTSAVFFLLFWKNSQLGELEGWLYFEQISDGQLTGNQVIFFRRDKICSIVLSD